MTEPTLVEVEQRRTVAYNLHRIMAVLGLDSVSTAALLRNPGDDYPGDALVRLMLTQRQNPSERFARLVETRLAEVESQLQAGVQVSTIAGQYQRVYRVEPKQHLITVIPEAQLHDATFRTPEDLSTIVIASLAVPAEWVETCPICGKVYVRRNTQQWVCRRLDTRGRFPCVTELARRRRAERRKRDREAADQVQRAIARVQGGQT